MKKARRTATVILILLAAYVGYTLLRPLPLQVSLNELNQPQTEPLHSSQLGLSRAAIGFIEPGNGQIICRPLGQGSNYDTARATASLAKLITAQVVLDKRPLSVDSTGPTITMSDDDESRYWDTVNNNGSNVKVVAGDELTERQLLSGVLLASANNMADSLAVWAFGSIDSYHQAAKKWLAQHNLQSTIVGGDASGFDEETKSTPKDLCKIMLLAAERPELAQILSQQEVSMPGGEVIHSTNKLLGQNGVFAGKTGFTDQAGYGVMVASRRQANDLNIVTAAISLSHDSYSEAFEAARQLTDSLEHDLMVYVLDKDTVVGEVKTPWGQKGQISPNKSLYLPYWSDQPATIKSSLGEKLTSFAKQIVVGKLSTNDTSVSLTARSNVAPASWRWRILHPFN